MKIVNNASVVYAKSVDHDKVVVVLKSPCRHYSAVLLKVDEDENGNAGLFVTDVKRRCGIKKCMQGVF